MISVIIVGYNSKKYLNDCLSSIFESSYKNFKVIFVDNNSSDDSSIFIKKKFPKVEIIESKKNLGFAGGNNLGIKKALQNNSDFVFLLNPDTMIDKLCMEKLVKKTDNKTILQPLILIHENNKKTDLVNTTGGYLNFLGFSYCSDYRVNKKTVKEKDIAIASGAAVFIPSVILKKIGLFDESFFMYHEDVDLFWRARLYGFNIQLIPEAWVWHKYSFSKNKNKFFYVERNRLLFLFGNFGLKYLLLILPIFIVNEIMILFYSLATGWFLLKIKSYCSFVKLMNKLSKKRKNNLKNFSEPERTLKRFISSEISFSEVKSSFFLPYNAMIKLYCNLIYPLLWIFYD